MPTPEYDVALSFAGEDRPYADALADALKQRGIRVFYDLDEQATLWGKNLYSYLSDLYQHRAHYCVMFLSQKYARKVWTNHERQAAQARAFTESREYILPIRLDDTKIPGVLSTVGYLDWHKTPLDTIADAIESKLVAIGDDEKDTAPPTLAPTAPEIEAATTPRTHASTGTSLGTVPATAVASRSTTRQGAYVIGCLLAYPIEGIGLSFLGKALLDWLLSQFSVHQTPVQWTTQLLIVAGFIWTAAYLIERLVTLDYREESISPLFPLHYLGDIFHIHSVPDFVQWMFTTPLFNVACSWALAEGVTQAAVSYAHGTYSTIFYLVFGISTVASLIAFVRRHRFLE